MKIRGRQRPINEFVKDMQDRLRKIGGGYGSAIFDENSTLNNGVDIQDFLHEVGMGGKSP